MILVVKELTKSCKKKQRRKRKEKEREKKENLLVNAKCHIISRRNELIKEWAYFYNYPGKNLIV